MSRRGARAGGLRVGLGLALFVAGVAAPAAATAFSVQVQVIYATNEESGIDPALAPHAQAFSSFRYSAYRRVGVQTLPIAGSAPVTMTLPGDRRLDVAPRRVAPEEADLRITVMEGGRRLLASDVHLAAGGQPIILGGFRHQQGVLFLAIQALR